MSRTSTSDVPAFLRPSRAAKCSASAVLGIRLRVTGRGLIDEAARAHHHAPVVLRLPVAMPKRTDRDPDDRMPGAAFQVIHRGVLPSGTRVLCAALLG